MSNWSDVPLLPVAWGEVFDKLTILQIKELRIKDEGKLKNILREKHEIEKVIGDLNRFPNGLSSLVEELREINQKLWDIEDGKRACERAKVFGEEFIELARKVYFGNDQRADIKKRINHLLGSAIVEEKSHQSYI